MCVANGRILISFCTPPPVQLRSEKLLANITINQNYGNLTKLIVADGCRHFGTFLATMMMMVVVILIMGTEEIG